MCNDFFFIFASIPYLLSYSQVASLAARLLQYAAIINQPTVCQRSICTLFGTAVFGTELLNKYPIKSMKVIRKFRYPGKYHQLETQVACLLSFLFLFLFLFLFFSFFVEFLSNRIFFSKLFPLRFGNLESIHERT